MNPNPKPRDFSHVISHTETEIDPTPQSTFEEELIEWEIQLTPQQLQNYRDYIAANPYGYNQKKIDAKLPESTSRTAIALLFAGSNGDDEEGED